MAIQDMHVNHAFGHSGVIAKSQNKDALMFDNAEFIWKTTVE